MMQDDFIGYAAILAVVIVIGMFSSCTYYAGVNYNQCVVAAEASNAQYCKVVL